MSTMLLSPEPARLIVVMGVSGAGKSSVGKALARRLHAPFLDADDFHPAENIDKLGKGIALTDADRAPWLEAFARALAQAGTRKGVAVGACSALHRAYREKLVETAGEPIVFVHLVGERELIAERLAGRRGHFMAPALLENQFETLEPPDPLAERVIAFSIAEPLETIARKALAALGHLRGFKRKQ